MNILKNCTFVIILLWAVVALSGFFGDAFAQVSDENLLKSFQWRNIGPANMGGRVVDFEAVDNDFKRVFLAAASGGVWKSTNAGTTWEPIFDNYPSASIGDIAIFQPNPDIIWVGTGEANNRNSVAWGDGIYKSTDGGETFTYVGLKETHQIARVVTHPDDPNIVYVAAIGHLWGYSGDRGLFKTTDGGNTWTKLTNGLPDDGKTGCTELVMDPNNSDILYTAFYQRLRRPWTFHSGGPNGGIFKSINGGISWTKLTSGLPEGDTGRIGLAIYRSNPNILMAIVEAQRSNDLSVPGSGIYRSEDGGNSWKYVNTYNNRPFYYSQIRINPLDDQRVYVLTTSFQVSEDGGNNFSRGGPGIEGDFHAMWLDPNDTDRYYIGNDKGAHFTHDHGRNFIFFDTFAIAQYYAIGVDMRDPYYVYGGLQDNGTWAGPSFSRDARGILNDSNWKLHWGDGMYVQIDPTDWRTVYTEAENGSFRLYDAETYRSTSRRPSAQNISNYDQVIQIPEPEQRGGQRARSPFRFNWTSPLVMSSHNPKTLYLGGNYLFKTVDGGVHWEIISPDLSTNNPEKFTRELPTGVMGEDGGAETHCAITTFSESPITPGLLWVGTDDGNVHVTRNGGKTWTDIRGNIPGVPANIWVTRVEASHFEEAAAYVTFDGHRSDIFQPFIFKTTDYGQSWTNITNNMPDGQAVYVIKEDLKNPNLLFVGTEFGCFVSLNGGNNWSRFMNNMPTVSIHDLVIHPRDNDLVAGTHGRSIWIADDITPLQQLTEEALASDGHLFENRAATLWENVNRGGQRGHHFFGGENPPSVERTSDSERAGFRNYAFVSYYLKSTPRGEATLEISDLSGNNKYTAVLSGEPGINRYRWDLRFDPPPITEQQSQQIVQEAQQRIQTAQNEQQRQQLQQALTRFQQAQTDRDRRQAMQALTGGGRRGGGFGGGGFGGGGATAGPGIYLLKMAVNGNIYTGMLRIRQDPILEERNYIK